MRKIEIDMLKAIRQQKAFKSGNTEVKVFPDDDIKMTVLLHGNPIIKINKYGIIHASDCGWQTATTKSRINAVLSDLTRCHIMQKDHRWYVIDENKKMDTFGRVASFSPTGEYCG